MEKRIVIEFSALDVIATYFIAKWIYRKIRRKYNNYRKEFE